MCVRVCVCARALETMLEKGHSIAAQLGTLKKLRR